MKAKVRLTHTIEMFVEGKDEDAIRDWMLFTLPTTAAEQAPNCIETFDEAIVRFVKDDTPVDYVIK